MNYLQKKTDILYLLAYLSLASKIVHSVQTTAAYESNVPKE